MYVIKTFSLGRAHELIIEKILKHGKIVKTEDGEDTIELNEPLSIHCDTPFNDYMISKFNKFGKKAMEQYVKDLIEGSENEFSYTYNERLFHYKVNNNGEETCINQIDYIINKLKIEPTSRRAEAITWQPHKDTKNKNPPCLQRIQCLIRDNKLNMHVEFRSNDMLSASGANMYALVHLQKYIADALELDVGWYSHLSTSAHIYHNRDKDELMNYINGLNLYFPW